MPTSESAVALEAAQFGAVPPANPRRQWLFGIEVLRGVAAISVVFHHMWSLGTMPRFPGYWIIEGFGAWGVSLFFVLSGFLLADYFWKPKSPGRLQTFYIRRFFRIAPAYYVSVAILFLFFANHQQLFSTAGFKQILANLTFTQYLFPSTSSNLNVNGVYWTLTLEMLLYLVMPALALFTLKTRGWGVLAMITVGLGFKLYVARAGGGLQDLYFVDGFPDAIARLFLARQFLGVLPLFAVGIGLKWLVTQRSLRVRLGRLAEFPRSLVVCAALVPSVVMLVFVERASSFNHWIWFTGWEFSLAVLFVPAILVAADPTENEATPLDRPFIWLGVRSYGLYLWHFPIILTVYGRGAEMLLPDVQPFVIKAAIILVVSVGAAALSWWAIERPAQEFGRRLSTRPRQAR